MSKKLAKQHLYHEISRLSYTTCNADLLSRLFSALSWYADAVWEEPGMGLQLQDVSRNLDWEAGLPAIVEDLLNTWGCESLQDLSRELAAMEEKITKLEDELDRAREDN